MMQAVKKWWKDDSASPAIEAAFIFPVLVSLLCGTVDIGTAIVVNMKVINACQTVSDLSTRGTSVTTADLTDAIAAGRLAIQPYSTASYGVDIAGIQFLNAALTPTVQWRQTQNMQAQTDILAKSQGLGAQNEGVVATTVMYSYQPFFSGYFTGAFSMKQQSFARGRKGTFVTKV